MDCSGTAVEVASLTYSKSLFHKGGGCILRKNTSKMSVSSKNIIKTFLHLFIPIVGAIPKNEFLPLPGII